MKYNTPKPRLAKWTEPIDAVNVRANMLATMTYLLEVVGVATDIANVCDMWHGKRVNKRLALDIIRGVNKGKRKYQVRLYKMQWEPTWQLHVWCDDADSALAIHKNEIVAPLVTDENNYSVMTDHVAKALKPYTFGMVNAISEIQSAYKRVEAVVTLYNSALPQVRSVVHAVQLIEQFAFQDEN